MSNSDQVEKINLFRDITQISDEHLCLEILSQNNWNVELAVDNFMQGRTSSTASGQRQRNSRPGVGSRSSPQQVTSVNQPITQNTWNPLRWLFQSHPMSLNPELDSRRFLADFNSEYGSQHPTFLDSSYQSAVVNSFHSSQFLLVYIHSPMHDDTPSFCRQVLCTNSFSRFVDREMFVWAGRIWDPEAYSLSIQLRATTFPFLALLLCQSERAVQVIRRFQGKIDEATLTGSLQNVVDSQRASLNRMRDEAQRREESTQLREQQDREYREAIEEDLREGARKRREEEAALLAEEAAAAAKLEKEAIELSMKLHHEASVSRKRASLAQEPPQSADTATVRFQLPQSCQSAKITRRFLKSDSIQQLTDFLLVHFSDSGSPVVHFSLSTHFPKRELDDMHVTVEDAGLFPRGMLYVNDLDA